MIRYIWASDSFIVLSPCGNCWIRFLISFGFGPKTTSFCRVSGAVCIKPPIANTTWLCNGFPSLVSAWLRITFSGAYLCVFPAKRMYTCIYHKILLSKGQSKYMGKSRNNKHTIKVWLVSKHESNGPSVSFPFALRGWMRTPENPCRLALKEVAKPLSTTNH